MLIQAKLWDDDSAQLVDATLEADRTDDDELVVYVRRSVGHDGDPVSIYVPRDEAGALIGQLSVLASGPKRLTR